jgi:hypothetical protein
LGQYTASDRANSDILATDGRLVLEAFDRIPEIGDRVRVNGKALRIMSVQRIRKAAADVVFICQLRAN